MSQFYTPPKVVYLASTQGKGMEITGTWTRRNNSIFFELTIANRAMAPMGDFAILFNKNR